MASGELEEVLSREQERYWSDKLIRTFDWDKVVAQLKEFTTSLPYKNFSNTAPAAKLASLLIEKAQKQSDTASKFQKQLKELLIQALQTGNTTALQERAQKAILYFAKLIGEELLRPLQEHITTLQYAVKVRKYVNELRNVETFLWQHLQKLTRAKYGNIILCKDNDLYNEYKPGPINQPGSSKREGRPIKGNSQRDSLSLFKKGISIEKIAGMRQLAVSTIQGHLANFIKTGEIQIYELVPKERVDVILNAIEKDANTTIKERLGDAYTYAEIRAVLNYHYWQIGQTM
jgi:hypothetical protein